MRVFRFLFIALAVVVASVVTIYLGINVAGVLSAQGKRNALSDQITQRIADELPSSQRRADAIADRTGAEPDHSWTAQHCTFATNDGGWIVLDHRQVCSLESATAWQVDSADEAFALVGERIPPGLEPYRSGACHSFIEPGETYGAQVAYLYIEPSATDDRWCDPSDEKYDQRRPITGDLPDLDGSRGWLVVVDTKELVDEVIGCVHWSVLFCDNPFGGDPAWGEPPA